ncbi:hypothetical protein Syun_021480 [Stephania yunnanensis]|uniref:Uncharacterized protein n=1 Tax=Stephania yunnanensis TaxID=152371 RepID=A0AAP0NPS7_9MAGN
MRRKIATLTPKLTTTTKLQSLIAFASCSSLFGSFLIPHCMVYFFSSLAFLECQLPFFFKVGTHGWLVFEHTTFLNGMKFEFRIKFEL